MTILRKSALVIISLLLISVFVLAGCTTTQPAASTSPSVAPSVAAPSPSAEGKKDHFSIVLLDGTNGNAWRAQMEQEMSTLVDDLKGKGVIAKYTAYSANGDATTQSQQMSQVINSGDVDAILVDPVSGTALNPVIDQAIEKGILVLGIDSNIAHPKVISVTTDQAEWAKIQAEFLAKELGGKGNIVIFNGIAGFPASEVRTKAYHDVLAKYPDIKVLQEVTHDWDEGKAKQLMTTMISAYPQIDGVLNQECSPGIMSAFTEAKKPLPKVICSDESMNYLRMWSTYNEKNPDKKLDAIIVGNPPGIGVTGLKIAIQLLQGKKIKDSALSTADTADKNALFIKPTLVITNDNLAEWVTKTKDMPDTYTFSNALTDDEISALMQ